MKHVQSSQEKSANRQRCFDSIGDVYVFVRHNQQKIEENTKNILKNVSVFLLFFREIYTNNL